MKSVDKSKGVSITGLGKGGNLSVKETISSGYGVMLIAEGIEQTGKFLTAILSYLSERQKTAAIKAEWEAKVALSEHRMYEVREREITRRLEITLQSVVELEKLATQREKLKMLKEIIQEVISTTNELKCIFSETNDRHILDMITAQNISLLNLARSVNAMVVESD